MAVSRFLFFCRIRTAASVSTEPSSAPEESPVNYNEDYILILTLQGQKYPRISMNVIFIKVSGFKTVCIFHACDWSGDIFH